MKPELAVFAGLLLFCIGKAEATVIVDTSAGVAAGGTGHSISGFVIANDFTLTQSTTLTDLRVWLLDGLGDNDVLDNFSGTLSWGIFADSSGTPSTVATHTASASGLSATDAGFQTLGRDVGFVDISLSGPTLGAGTYWLALHEGAWESADDNSSVFWHATSTTHGDPSHFEEPNETAVGTAWQSRSKESAFILQGSSTVIPEPTTLAIWSVLGGIGLAAGRWRRRWKSA